VEMESRSRQRSGVSMFLESVLVIAGIAAILYFIKKRSASKKGSGSSGSPNVPPATKPQ